MRMRRVHLSMRTDFIKAFSKRTRRCSVDGRKRYENGVDENLFETEQKSSVFVWKRISVHVVLNDSERNSYKSGLRLYTCTPPHRQQSQNEKQLLKKNQTKTK